jgi:hypothetical protein
VNSGDSATFNCSVSGSPIESVWWLRNGDPVLPMSEVEAPSGSRIRLLSQLVLNVAGVTRSDRGMYQCFVRNDKESAQGSAELRLGGEFVVMDPFASLWSSSQNPLPVILHACYNSKIDEKICMQFLPELTN